MGQISLTVLDTLIAPGLSRFRSAAIPDLRPEFDQADYWLANHLLNTLLRGRYKEGMRQIALSFLRRAQHGFHIYHVARDKTLAFVNCRIAGGQPLLLYMDAVNDWEIFVLDLQMAIDLFKGLTHGQEAFAKNDGSPAQRLYDVANAVKHARDRVETAKCRPEDTLPLWVLSDGLHSFLDLCLGFEEAAKVLREVSGFADLLQDPTSFTASEMAEECVDAD